MFNSKLRHCLTGPEAAVPLSDQVATYTATLRQIGKLWINSQLRLETSINAFEQPRSERFKGAEMVSYFFFSNLTLDLKCFEDGVRLLMSAENCHWVHIGRVSIASIGRFHPHWVQCCCWLGMCLHKRRRTQIPIKPEVERRFCWVSTVMPIANDQCAISFFLNRDFTLCWESCMYEIARASEQMYLLSNRMVVFGRGDANMHCRHVKLQAVRNAKAAHILDHLRKLFVHSPTSAIFCI